MSDTALTIRRLDVPAPTKDDPKRRLKIGAKLRVAIDAIVFDGAAFDEAARKANCTTRAIRKAFERAHVLTYLRTRKEVLRASANGQNIRRLMQIRDKADNMPAVQAIRMLEQLGEDTQAGSRGSVSVPGLVVVIQTGDRSATIEPVPHDVTPKALK
jgi:hypothetical protein